MPAQSNDAPRQHQTLSFRHLLHACFLIALAALLGGVVVGCNSPPVKQGETEMSIPADFSVQFRVHGKAGAKELVQQPVDYLVESNRAFRVAGASWGGTQSRAFPPLLRYLDYSEFDSIYRVITANNLSVEPTSPLGERAMRGEKIDEAWYEITIQANGRTQKFATTGGESPPSSLLLIRLYEVRYRRKLGVSPQTQPAAATSPQTP